jgi:hypothetical protein
MHPPARYSVPEGIVCHLRLSLYGLKQAPHAWFQRFASLVTATGFSADMIITGDDPGYIAFVKPQLSDQFLMFDLGPLRYFHGIEICSTPEGFFLSQEKYIQDLLDCTSLTDHQTTETPMELNVHLMPTDGEPLEDPTRYHHIVGSLVYLGVTRPDISYSKSVCLCSHSDPL